MAVFWSKGMALFVLFIGTISCGILFGYSMYQVADVDHDPMNVATTMPGKTKGGSNECESPPYRDHRPWDVTVVDQNASKNVTVHLKCGWNPLNTTIRAIATSGGFFAGLALLYLVAKEKRRYASMMLLIFTVSAGVALFVSMIMDSADVAKSREWCDQGMPNSKTWDDGLNPKCYYDEVIATCVVDALLSLVLGGLTPFVIFRFLREQKKRKLIAEVGAMEKEKYTPTDKDSLIAHENYSAKTSV